MNSDRIGISMINLRFLNFCHYLKKGFSHKLVRVCNGKKISLVGTNSNVRKRKRNFFKRKVI